MSRIDDGEQAVKRDDREPDRIEILMWYAAMTGAAAAMPAEARAELEAWERRNLDGGTVGTSDWPGWAHLIGPKPVPAYRKPVSKQPIPGGLRKQILERDAYRCRLCGDWHDLHVDHIIPESRGGPTIFDNLQTLCRTCNLKKGNRT